MGLVPKGQIMRRKSKQDANVRPLSLFVTGTIGDSALGLMLTKGRGFSLLTPDEVTYLKQRHLAPEPRLHVARAIRGFAKACIDISDGLVADVGHIAEQSNAQAVIHAHKIPLSPAAQKLVKAQPELLETLITGGEDYELAFALDPTDESLLTIAAAKLNVPLTKIGEIKAGTSGEVQVLDKEKPHNPPET